MRSDIKSFLLRTPINLFRKLKLEGKRRGQSVNSLCVSMLQGALQSENRPPQLHAFSVMGDFSERLHAYIQEAIVPGFPSALIGVVLFGSAARNEMKQNSDIDLLVVLREDFSLDRDSYTRVPARTIKGHPVSPLIVQLPSPESKPRTVWLEAAVDGCILYDTDFILSRRLIAIRDAIVSGAIKREFAYGVPYWVHQEPHSGENMQ